MKRLFFDNIALKIFSLLFAAMLWFYLTLEKDAEISFPVKVEIINLPKSMVVVDGTVKNATVWVSGLRRTLMNISPENISVNVNLKNADEGMVVYPINPDELNLPENINVKMIVPQVLNLRLEKLVKKKLKVVPRLIGELPRGTELVGVTADPERTAVLGRKSRIEGMEEIPTYPINISNIKQSLTYEVPVDLKSAGLRETESDKMIRVKVEVQEKIITREIKDLPIMPGGAGDEVVAEIEPAIITINVKGPEILVENLKQEDIQVVLITENLRVGRTYKKKAEIVLPEKIQLIDTDPVYFSVKVVKRNAG